MNKIKHKHLNINIIHDLKHLRLQLARHLPKDTSTSKDYVLTSMRDHFKKETRQKKSQKE